MRRLLSIALTAALWGCGEGAPRTLKGERAEVLRVVDGDTIVVVTGGVEETVRLLGIDTPEREPRECGHRAATRALERLAAGREVELVGDPSQARRDRYGRRLAYVDTLDGSDLGKAIVRGGWARVYVFGEPFEREDAYREAYADARTERAGLFGACS